jgi:hypothetical protein
MTTARFWRVCGFVLLLLFVQQQVLTHALQHVAASQQIDAGDDDGDCQLCLALSGVQGVGGMPRADLPVDSATGGVMAFASSPAAPRRSSLAHAIRAPPQIQD